METFSRGEPHFDYVWQAWIKRSMLGIAPHVYVSSEESDPLDKLSIICLDSRIIYKTF